MAKIADWNRVYWNNSKGTREYDPEEIDPDDAVMCIYGNDHGDQVAYRLTDRRETVELSVDVSDAGDDEDSPDAEKIVGEEIEARLDDLEDESEHGIKDATETAREEDGDEVTVTLDVEWDIPKYEVTFNGEVISDVEFPEGSRWFKDDLDEDEEQRDATVEVAQFPTRAMAREFAAAWRDDFGAPEQLGYEEFSFEEVMDMDYQDEVVPLAKEYGVMDDADGRDHESLAEAISGEEAPQEDETEDEQEEEAEA